MTSDDLNRDSSAKLDSGGRSLVSAEVELSSAILTCVGKIPHGSRKVWDAALLTAADGLQNPGPVQICSM